MIYFNIVTTLIAEYIMSAIKNVIRIAIVVSFILCAHATAAESSSTVLLITLAETKEGQELERRFLNELGLALTQFQVKSESNPDGSFGTMLLSERLAIIRSLSKKHNASAVIWIERFEDNKLLLNLTAISTGRALLRIVEVKKGPHSEAELALATEELLGEAYLFSPNKTDNAISSTVEKVRQTVVSLEESSKRKTQHAISGGVLLSGGLYERIGSSLTVGGGIGWIAETPSGWFFGPSVFGFAGPKERLSAGVISGFGIIGEFSFGYHFHISKVQIGPALSAGIKWNRMEALFGENGTKQVYKLGFRGTVSLDSAVSIGKQTAFIIRLDLSFLPERAEFRGVSENSAALVTPWLEGSILMGLRLFL